VSRRVEQLPPDWVGPEWLKAGRLGAAIDTGHRNWTTLGSLASRRTAIVDQGGLVTPWFGGWSLDWWIGADDRWHFPSTDAGVRQRLIEGTPVVETAMRIPSGDAVQRAYVVRASSRGAVDEWLAVEILNASRVPFALALAVRPYNTEGLALVEEIRLVGETVMVNGTPALSLPAQPRLMAGSTFAEGDSAAVVTSGGATDALSSPLRCPAGLAQAAFLYPLAHTACMRVAMPLSPDRGHRPVRRRRRPASSNESPNPTGLPSSADAARAWQALTRRGLHIDLPPGRLADAIEANRRYLLLFHVGRGAPEWPEAASAVAALDRYGFHDEAAELLAGAFDRRGPDALGAAVWALAEHWRLSGDTDLVTRLAPVVARSVRRIRRARRGSDSKTLWVRRGLLDGAALLSAGGERLGAEAPEAPDHDDIGQLPRLLDAASPTWTWPEAGPTTIEFCSVVRNLLVREAQGGLVLLTRWPDSWLGQAVEVRDAPTHAGLLSYAVRWHGDRPALLWELRRRDTSRPTRLRAPGLDPSWTTDEPDGEVLLAVR
jgi:hypothetical protein